MLTPNLRHLTMRAPYIFQKTSSSQSNLDETKQNNLALGEYLQNIDLNDIKSVGIRVARNSCTNFPDIAIDQGWGILEVLSTGTDGFLQRLSISKSAEYSPPLYERMYNGSNWTKWGQIALATPPQEFDLPLAEGYTQNNGCKYSKDQFNVVRVTFNLSKSAGTIAGGEVVATLPAGFRPKRYWGCVAIGNNIPSDAATRHPVVVQVATNGEISASMMAETDQAELRAIVCAMEFLAAD